IEGCEDLTTLEDLYLPYKKSRKTKADTAREQGLEPLAKIVMAQNATNLEGIASRYISKQVSSAEEALDGARHIIAQWIKQRIDIRNQIRRQFQQHATIQTKKVEDVEDKQAAEKHRDYFNWHEALAKCPSHRLLAI